MRKTIAGVDLSVSADLAHGSGDEPRLHCCQHARSLARVPVSGPCSNEQTRFHETRFILLGLGTRIHQDRVQWVTTEILKFRWLQPHSGVFLLTQTQLGGSPGPGLQACPRISHAVVATRPQATRGSRCPHFKSLPEQANIFSLDPSHGPSTATAGREVGKQSYSVAAMAGARLTSVSGTRGGYRGSDALGP